MTGETDDDEDKVVSLTLNDLHFKNDLKFTTNLISSLWKCALTKEVLERIAILYLAGDIFDHSLTLCQEALSHVIAFIVTLLKHCKANNIIVRVLNGTPSHDIGQSRLFVTLNKSYNINVNLRYITEVEVEYIQPLNIHVLYIPDEYSVSAAETQKIVRKCLRSAKVIKVDYCIMHGFFEHQLTYGNSALAHSTRFYTRITKRYTFIGHYHKRTRKGHILGGGAFERDSHGYEEDKGAYYVTSYGGDRSRDKVEFLVNLYSAPYKSIDIRKIPKEETEMVYEKVDRELSKLPAYANVMTKEDPNRPHKIAIQRLKGKYADLHFKWTLVLKGDVDRKEGSRVLNDVSFSAVAFNENTAVDIMSEKLSDRGLAAMLEIMKEISDE